MVREAKAPWIDQSHDDWKIRLRLERLWEAKQLEHRAVEFRFRALCVSLQALYGQIEIREARLKSVEKNSDSNFDQAA